MHHSSRILEINLNNIQIIATHVDYGFYNPFVMHKIEDYVIKNSSNNMIIGDFNSGYIEDNLDIDDGGIVFQNGFLYFKKYEELGYTNAHKGKGIYSYINPRSKRKFRLDHCFYKDIDVHVEYEDSFLDKKISDHKGILVKVLQC